MKKMIAVLFIFVGLAIAFFAIKEHWDFSSEEVSVQSSDLSPEVFASEQISGRNDSSIVDEANSTVLIPLLSGETLIGTHNIDFNKDNYGDQLIAIKNSEDPFIRIVVGLYNPALATYERSYILTTEIEQARTFSFSVMDITGTHENALIINGYSNNNESMLQAWLRKKNTVSFDLELIADLEAEGIIFIQQSNRNASYVLSTIDGDSFPILAYTSDPAASEGSLDQLHIMYDWDKSSRKYVQKTRTRIPGKTINAQELAKIQDGTEKTFASFLDTLWANPTGAIEGIPYLFFDYAQKEITFLKDDTAEVYSWERSILRRNGILISASSKAIPKRNIDIALISVDEIRIKVTDYLNMLISSVSVWDGNYKKQNSNIVFKLAATANIDGKEDMSKLLQTNSQAIWEGDNGYNLSFSESLYTANNETVKEIGVFAIFTVEGENFLQFRSQSLEGVFTGFYRPEIVYLEEPDTNLIGTRIILSPIKIRAGKVEPAVDKVLTLELISTD